MGMWGKILAVLNVLAAGGFVVLATMDWGKRRDWTYAAYRHELALDGLAVDENDKAWAAKFQMTPDEMGEHTVNDLAKAAGGEVLGAAGTKPVRTLKAEVERVRNKVFDHINAADGEANRFVRARAYLINLFESGSDRDRIYALPTRNQQELSDARKTVEDELRGYFERAQDQAGDSSERRRRIAHLLYNLDRSADWHLRVQTLVGLENYVTAADAQAGRLVAMIKQMRGLIAYEQSTFEGQYSDLVEESRTLAGRVYAIDREIADQNRIKTEQEALVGARKTDVETLSAELDKARKDLIALLTKQANIEQRVFEEQTRLRNAQDANVRMERQLRKIETGK